MIQNNGSNLNQIENLQNLLYQLSNYVSKINEIIFQMNIIINQRNQPLVDKMNNIVNYQMMQMNNFNNFQNNINLNNNLNQNIINQNLSCNNLINIIFEHCNGMRLNLLIEKNRTIKELINTYFQKIEKPELINNYKGIYYFEYNMVLLDKLIDKKIGDVLADGCHVLAKKISEMSVI